MVTVTQDNLEKVARRLWAEMGGDDAHVFDRNHVTELVRDESGSSTTRVKSVMGAGLDQALTRLGLVAVPGFSDTGSPHVLIMRRGSAAAEIFDIFETPTPAKGRHLVRLAAATSSRIRVF